MSGGGNDTAHDRRQRRLLIGLALLFFAPLAVSFYLYYGGEWRPLKHVNHGDLVNPARPLPEVSLPIARDPARAVDAGTTGEARGGPEANASVAGEAPIDTTGGIGATSSPGGGTPAARTSAGGSAFGPGGVGVANTTTLLKGKWTLLYWGAGRCDARCRTDLYNMRQVRIALNRDMDRVQRVFVAEGECCDWHYLDYEHPDLITVRATPTAAPLLALLPAYAGIEPRTADRVYLIDPLGNLMMSYAPDAKPKGMLEDLKRLLGLSSVG